MIKKGKYQHYKNLMYEVVDTAIHSETLEEMVIYKPLYGASKLWVRPLEMFKENVRINNEDVPRFKYVGD